MVYQKPHIPDLRAVAKSLKAVARTTAMEHIEMFAVEERDAFRARIAAQQFQSFAAIPLSPQWLARKKAAGADLRTMIATSHYLGNIKVQHRLHADGSATYMVGHDDATVAKKLDGTDADILLQDVAKVQEMGSANHKVPARPHWGPHLNDMHERAPKTRKAIRSDVAKRLKLLHPHLPQAKGL